MWSRPTSKGLDNFLYTCVCLLAPMLCIHVCFSKSRLRHALCPPWAYACQSLRPLACMVASVPLVACLDVIACETKHKKEGYQGTKMAKIAHGIATNIDLST